MVNVPSTLFLGTFFRSVQRELLAMQHKEARKSAAASSRPQDSSTTSNLQDSQSSPSFHDYLALEAAGGGGDQSPSLEAVQEVLLKQEPIEADENVAIDQAMLAPTEEDEPCMEESVKLECDVEVSEAMDQSDSGDTT